MKRLLMLIALVITVACGSTPSVLPTAPEQPIPAPAPVPVVPTVTTLLLSGQSNAVLVRPFLESAYTVGKVDGWAYGGTEIGQWLTETPWTWATFGFSPWTYLKPTLKQEARAFVWWQGESDARDSYRPNPYEYRGKLAQFITNVRAENGQGDLFIVVCQILEGTDAEAADTAVIRDQLRAYVVSEPRSVLVSSDGLAKRDTQHLTDEGYKEMAQRIIAALPR